MSVYCYSDASPLPCNNPAIGEVFQQSYHITEVLRKRFVVNHNTAGQIKLTAAESYFSILNWGCYAASMFPLK